MNNPVQQDRQCGCCKQISEHFNDGIVGYLLKVRIVKPVQTAIAREWLCKHTHC